MQNDMKTMISKILRSAIGGVSLIAAGLFFLGFVKIAIDYNWSFTEEINFGEANGTPIIGGVWIPLALCLTIGMMFMLIASQQLSKVFKKKKPYNALEMVEATSVGFIPEDR